MITGTCHCGAVSYTFNDTPKSATSCNCSICRRLGTLWIYSAQDNITFSGAENTLSYAHGEKNLTFHTCKTCGCTTHWADAKDPKGPMAVNLRLAELDVVAKVPVRNFDGAETWTFFED